MSIARSSVKIGVLSFIAASMALQHNALAGNEGAHGGQGVVCQDSAGKITSIQMYDYYEGSIYLNSAGTLDLGPPTVNYQDRISYVLTRLAKMDPIAAARFQERALSFESEMAMLDDPQMVSIGDAHHVINPDTGCYTDQFAVQFFNLKPGQTKRYFVNKDLWNVADSTAKAGLVLHEVIYRDAVEAFNQTDSDLTRYYNYMISSTAMNSITPESYRQIVKASKFSSPSFQCLFSETIAGVPLCGDPVLTTEDSTILGVDFPIGGYIGYLVEPVTIRLRDGQNLRIQGVPGQNDQVAFDSNQNLTHFVLTADTQIQIGQYSLTASTSDLVLYPDRSVHALVPRSATFTLPTSAGNLTFAGCYSTDYLDFFQDGLLQSGALSGDSSIVVGDLSLVIKQGRIEFDHSGAVIQVTGTNPFTAKIGAASAQILSATQFYTNGQVQSAVVPGGQSFIDIHGDKVKLKNGNFGRIKKYQVQFDSSGRLISSSEVSN